MGSRQADHDQRRDGRGCRKKLRSALRYDLERKGTDEFLADLVDEEGDAAATFVGRESEFERPEEAKLDPELILYWRAWGALRSDRYFGDSGGVGRIYFTALDVFAQRYGIEGCAFEVFRQLVSAMDDEYIAWEIERQKAEAEKRKHEER